MTKKHRFYFLLWKIKMYFKGFEINTPVKVYSEDKKRFIKGYIQQFTGDSITKKKFGFEIHVLFLEPLSGNDTRWFSSGFYSEKSIKEKILQIF